jgi:hypothetical protein
MRLAVFVLVVGLTFVCTKAAHAANACCVDGPCVYAATLYTGTTPLSSLCGHYIGGAGGCTINMTQDESVSTYVNCVQLDGKVTLNMNEHAITCSGSSCRDAIFSNSGPSVVNKVIGDGSITGPWDYGMHDTGANTGTIQDVHITLTGAKVSRGVTSMKNVTRVVVEGATDVGIVASTGDTIQDSIVADNPAGSGGAGVGVALSPTFGSSSGGTINGSLVVGNTVNISLVSPASINYTLNTCTVREATSCNFYDGTSCQPASVMSLSGTNFIDNTILH